MFERIWPSVFEKETLRIWFFAGMWYLLCMSVFILPKPGRSAGIAHLKSTAVAGRANENEYDFVHTENPLFQG